MSSNIFITPIETLTANTIKWKINTSVVKNGNNQFPVYRAIPTVGPNDSPLIIQTDKVFTFGVRESSKIEGDGLNYSIPLCMHDLNGPTEHQKKFVNACAIISESGRQFLLEHKDEFKKDWIASDLRNLNVLWQGKDSKGPTLYAKLPAKRVGETEKIDCTFIEPCLKDGRPSGRNVNPLLYRDVRCHVRAAVKIESIFVGAKVSFQTKIYELVVYPEPKQVSLLTVTDEDVAGLSEEEETELDADAPPLPEQTFVAPAILEPVAAPSTMWTPPVLTPSSPPPEPVQEMPVPRRGRAKKAVAA